MAQNPEDVTNPGLVNVADEGDGPLSIDQAVGVSPSSNPAQSAVAANSGLGGGVATITNPDLVNVASETFGIGLPTNIFV
jgi:hypothetical protein